MSESGIEHPWSEDEDASIDRVKADEDEGLEPGKVRELRLKTDIVDELTKSGSKSPEELASDIPLLTKKKARIYVEELRQERVLILDR